MGVSAKSVGDSKLLKPKLVKAEDPLRRPPTPFPNGISQPSPQALAAYNLAMANDRLAQESLGKKLEALSRIRRAPGYVPRDITLSAEVFNHLLSFSKTSGPPMAPWTPTTPTQGVVLIPSGSASSKATASPSVFTLSYSDVSSSENAADQTSESSFVPTGSDSSKSEDPGRHRDFEHQSVSSDTTIGGENPPERSPSKTYPDFGADPRDSFPRPGGKAITRSKVTTRSTKTSPPSSVGGSTASLLDPFPHSAPSFAEIEAEQSRFGDISETPSLIDASPGSVISDVSTHSSTSQRERASSGNVVLSMHLFFELDSRQFIFVRHQTPDASAPLRLSAITKPHGNGETLSDFCDRLRVADVLTNHERPKQVFFLNRHRVDGPSFSRLHRKVNVFVFRRDSREEWSPARRILLAPSEVTSLVAAGGILLDRLLMPWAGYWKDAFERIVKHLDVKFPATRLKSSSTPGLLKLGPQEQDQLRSRRRLADTLANPSSQTMEDPKMLLKLPAYLRHFHSAVKTSGTHYLPPIIDRYREIEALAQPTPIKDEICFRIWLFQLRRKFVATLSSVTDETILVKYIYQALSDDVQEAIGVFPATLEGLCVLVETVYPLSVCSSVDSPQTLSKVNASCQALSSSIHNVNSTAFHQHFERFLHNLRYHLRTVEDRTQVMHTLHHYVEESKLVERLVSLRQEWMGEPVWQQLLLSWKKGKVKSAIFVSKGADFLGLKMALLAQAHIAQKGFTPMSPGVSIVPPKKPTHKTRARKGVKFDVAATLDKNTLATVIADTLSKRVMSVQQNVPGFPSSLAEPQHDDAESPLNSSEFAWTLEEQLCGLQYEQSSLSPDSAEFEALDLQSRHVMKVIHSAVATRGSFRPPSELNLKVYDRFLKTDPRTPAARLAMEKILHDDLHKHPSNFCYVYCLTGVCVKRNCLFSHFCREGKYHAKSDDVLLCCSHVSQEVKARSSEFQKWELSRKSHSGSSLPKPEPWFTPAQLSAFGSPLSSGSNPSVDNHPLPRPSVSAVESLPVGNLDASTLAEIVTLVTRNLQRLNADDTVAGSDSDVSSSENDTVPSPEPRRQVFLVSNAEDVGYLSSSSVPPLLAPDLADLETGASLSKFSFKAIRLAEELANLRFRAPLVMAVQPPSASSAVETDPDLPVIAMGRGASMQFLQLYIQSIPIRIAWDGGSCVSFVSLRVILMFENIGIRFKKYAVTGGQVKAFGGTDVSINYAYALPLSVGNLVVFGLFFLGSDSDCSYDLLVGRDIHTRFGCITNEQTQVVTWVIDGVVVELPILPFSQVRSGTRNPVLPHGTLTSSVACVIPPGETAQVPVVSKVVAAVSLRMLLHSCSDGPDSQTSPAADVRLHCQPSPSLS